MLKCQSIYQLNSIKKIKKNCKKKSHERYQNLSKEEREKADNMVVNLFSSIILRKLRPCN